MIDITLLEGFMDRDILRSLEAWQRTPRHKPLILKGARQVGKTWVLKEFGRTHFNNCVYLSLEEIAPGVPSEYASLFQTTRNPHRLLQNISLAVGQPIEPGKTLLVLDEIQDCPAAIGALKPLAEGVPEYHIACAGSLLGVKLSRSTSSFPVGKVEFLDMHPLTFSEYLRGVGLKNLDEYANDLSTTDIVPEIFANQLEEQLRMYFMTGGMPEAVQLWAELKRIDAVDKVLSDLLDSYERDFAKHGGQTQFAKLSLVWNSLPTQLARENKKFMWGLVREGARAREYENAVEWLCNAGLTTRVRLNSAHGLPLTAYDDSSAFKIYCLDVGLLRRLSRLDASAFMQGDSVLTEFKGAFAENYVLQQLLPQVDAIPRYWTNDKPRHEVDFLIQVDNTIVPIEVKSGESVRATSLRYYTAKHEATTPLRVRMSMRGLSFDGTMLNIPLWLAHRAVPLMKEALA